MDLSDPTRSVTSSLDGPVLAVLAAAGRLLTAGEVASLAVRGSEIGIRKSLGRLVEQGIVRATVLGRNRIYELNREHVAAPVADVLAGLRNELWRRLREGIGKWDPIPIYACVFGSAARGDGDVASDIDLLLVHPPFPGEIPVRRSGSQGLLEAITNIAATSAPRPVADPDVWYRQVDELRARVQAWTGNRLQVVDLNILEWRTPADSTSAFLAESARDKVELIKSLPFALGTSA